MKLVAGTWKILVGIKDALVLIAMLIFFGLLFAALSATPNAAIGEGALLLRLNGPIVEQPAHPDPFATFGGGWAEIGREYRLRDLVRILDRSRTDTRVKVVVQIGRAHV